MSVDRNAKVDPPVTRSTTSIAPIQLGRAAMSPYAALGAKMTPTIRAGRLFPAAVVSGAVVCVISGLVSRHAQRYGLGHFRFRRRPADADPADVAKTFRSTPRPPCSRRREGRWRGVR